MEGLGCCAKAGIKEQQNKNGRRLWVNEARLRFINEGVLENDSLLIKIKAFRPEWKGFNLGGKPLLKICYRLAVQSPVYEVCQETGKRSDSGVVISCV